MDINNLFRLAAEAKASDIHLLFGRKPVFRIDGVLADIDQVVPAEKLSGIQPLSKLDLENFLSFLLSKEQHERFLEEKDIDTSYQVDDYRYRVNCAFERENVMVSARIIDKRKPTLEEIGLPDSIKNMLSLPQGFILITGPTGCGKSTTLAAMINYINSTRRCNIVTLEDPIEFLFESDQSLISQRQLGSDMVSFASGLKHVLRQDPNVIMLGEMRDPETIATAVTVAETGHLVLATLHTYSAAQTIDRIIDTFPPYQQNQVRSQLSAVLTAAVSQRLLPRQSGGRIAAREILVNNTGVANLIREGKVSQIKTAIETGSAFGMITLDKHIKQLFEAGEISREDAQRYLEDPEYLDK